jgi:nucleotide-binding universal stress UspA family protein
MKIFDRILVGIDGSAESLDALAQAKLLVASGGRLVAAVVCEEALAAFVGPTAARAGSELHAEAERARDRAEAELAEFPGAEARLLHGRPAPVLEGLARELGATLIALGSHQHRRSAGMLFGSVATSLVRESESAVLLVRARADGSGAVRRIVVGSDGSGHSLDALATAQELAERLGAHLRCIVSEGGKPVDADRLAAIPTEMLERDERSPVDALLGAAEQADLVVVGSRGLHGMSALGSVSERVAHRAPCSVLVVRSGGGREG